MMFFNLIFGFLLVFAGRNLFWVCVGIVGFLIGTQFAASLGFSNEMIELIIGIGLGCLGALLAISFEWFMVIFGVGFLGGGYLLMNIFPSTVQQDPYSWLIFVVGGIFGMCLMVIIFDWTLILISSLLGASLIVNAVNGDHQLKDLLFFAAAMIGMMVQYLSLKDTTHKKGEKVA